jgi:hypothetical protein
VFYENASSNVTVYNKSTNKVYEYDGTDVVKQWTDPNYVPEKISKNLNDSEATHVIHIPHLRPNEIVSLFYDVNDSAMGIDSGSLFVVDEHYNVSKIPANRIVTWKVYFNVSLNTTWIGKTNLSNVDVTLDITKYLSNNTADRGNPAPREWGSPNWTKLGPISNVEYSTDNGENWKHVDPTDGRYVKGSENTSFNITGIQLTTTQPNVNITFDVTGNNTGTVGHEWLLDPFGFAVFEFKLNGNVSGSAVLDAFAVGDINISANKSGPHYNGTEWALWIGNATIENSAKGLAYVITNTTVWASSLTKWWPPLSDEYDGGSKAILTETPNAVIYPAGSGLTTSYKTGDLKFNYSYVPIIWANCTFKLIHNTTYGWWANNTTLHDYNATYGGNYIVVEKIYVIGTYLIKVTKHVVPAGNNKWEIYIVVENVGGAESPIVYVYDLIPKNFSMTDVDGNWKDLTGDYVNKSSMFRNNGSVTSDLPGGYECGLWWSLNPIQPGANGDGAYEGDSAWTEIDNNQTVVIHYNVTGSGDFRMLDAFVVGIDPMFSMNEQTAPRITIVSGAKTENYETLFALITGLVSVGVILTRRVS